MRTATAAAGLLALAASASAHGYIKEWTANGVTQKAQKQSLDSTAFRSAPDNTGWIGSNFLTSPAITCGASNTPKGTVAAPGGTIFATADQAAGKTMAVTAGSDVELVISGNPGAGWPHHEGHVQTYLAFCGASATACQKFDASQGQFFKIQGEKDGIQDKLVPAYDGGVDGNRWKVPIPKTIQDGSYIMRFELIAFGQSGASEGQQDQYYPFCGQIAVSGGSGASPKLSTVKFPDAYQNGNIDKSTLPGPDVLAAGSTTVASGSGSSGDASDSSSNPPSPQSSGTGSSGSGSDSAASGSGSDSDSDSGSDSESGSPAKSCGSGRLARTRRAKRYGSHAHGKRVSARSSHGSS